MDETTQETAALDDNGDGQANVAKIVGPPPYWSSVGIEGPSLRERVVSVDRETGFGFEAPIDRGSDPANWPECVRRYLGTSNLAMHLYDHLRTRITPGADPRAEWAGGDDAKWGTPDPSLERVTASGPVMCGVSSIFRSDAWLRYVPEDVVRWRDPEHRAALTARAREYASHLPGRRA